MIDYVIIIDELSRIYDQCYYMPKNYHMYTNNEMKPSLFDFYTFGSTYDVCHRFLKKVTLIYVSTLISFMFYLLLNVKYMCR